MRDIPSRGLCHAIFLLAFSARVRKCTDVDAWIVAASDKPTYMAASLDIAATADLLLDAGLARVETLVIIEPNLARLDQKADLTTLKGIARLLLRNRPPDWLRAVYIDGQFLPEFIPQRDMELIAWLGDDLEEVVVTAYHQVYGAADEQLRRLLGEVGELAVMSALRRRGYHPRHASLVSDRFGYDIELQKGTKLCGFEVKAAVTDTAYRAMVSRNEFDVAKRMGNRWKIIQVTFSSRVLAQRRVTAADVEGIRELSSHSLVKMAPVENVEFRWTEAAEFCPKESEWKTSDLRVEEEFEVCLSKHDK